MTKKVSQLARFLIAVDLFIVCMFVLHSAFDLSPGVFNLDGEQVLGAWWGGGKLLVAGACVALIPLFARDRLVTGVSIYWAFSIGLAFLSADEVLMLHERITSYNKEYGFGLPMFRGTNGAWVSVYVTLFVLLALIFHRSILAAMQADPKSFYTIAGGLAVFVSGAVGAEVMGYYGLLSGKGSPLQLIIEEGLELIGVSVVLLGCVRHAVSSLTA
ncbi:MAG: hypothetical protein AAGF53_06805 [Pseudomonadota bacterium]